MKRKYFGFPLWLIVAVLAYFFIPSVKVIVNNIIGSFGLLKGVTITPPPDKKGS